MERGAVRRLAARLGLRDPAVIRYRGGAGVGAGIGAGAGVGPGPPRLAALRSPRSSSRQRLRWGSAVPARSSGSGPCCPGSPRPPRVRGAAGRAQAAPGGPGSGAL